MVTCCLRHLVLLAFVAWGSSGCAASPTTASGPTPAEDPALAPVRPTTADRAGDEPGLTSVEQVPAAAIEVPQAITNAVNAPDRDAEDRALDAGRMPAKVFAFFGIAPKMNVAEIGTGRGYSAELLARIVGPEGRVYAQNPRFVLEKFAEKPWAERLKKPVMKNVVRVDREFSDPLPPEAKKLDAVINVLFYHDTVWLKVDRAAMNRAIFDALRPGGVYGIVDHSASEGRGVQDAGTLHRIEAATLRDEVERAGFRLQAAADLLKNPADDRSWNASPSAAADKRGKSDRFVFRFVKPE